MSTKLQQFVNPAPGSSFRITPELEAALLLLATDVLALEGEILFQQGMSAKGVYLLIEGSARLSMNGEDGREITRRELGPGALLGVPATLCSKPYLFSAIATCQSRFGFIEKDKLDEYLRSHPGQCMEVVQMMSRELSEANQTRNLLRVCSDSECVLSSACSHQCH